MTLSPYELLVNGFPALVEFSKHLINVRPITMNEALNHCARTAGLDPSDAGACNPLTAHRMLIVITINLQADMLPFCPRPATGQNLG